MKKIKITESQYKRLISEIDGIKGGINRVDKTFKKVFTGSDIKTLTPNPDLMEDTFDIKDPIPGIPNSKMKKVKEPESAIDENIFSPEFHEAIHNFIQNIWMNPSHKGLDRVFVENGVTWGDIVSYLTSVGILAGVGAGVYKVTNFFKTKFSQDKAEKTKQKMEVIDKMTKMVEKDPEAPWNQETTYEKKQKMQARPDSGFKAEPKPFNPNRFKLGLEETEEDEYVYDKDYYNDVKKTEPERSKSKQVFKPVGMGKELAILNGPDGMYIFDYSNYRRDDLPNPDFDLDIEDITDFVNDNYKTLSKGEGIKSFEKGDDLSKIDEKLREELGLLYSKDSEFIKILNRLEEMTGAGSSGSFTGALGGGKPQVSPGYSPAEIINDEDAIYGKKIQEDTLEETDASSSGAYVGPQIWAKDKANWAGAHRTQYPHGEIVDFDPCTKLNNNKSAQSGKCSQGAIDHVVKTHQTKDSVISKSMYEAIAKKTGRTIEDVKRIIESKTGKQ
jgi:hypothetical protein